ncbi:transglutaminase family protein [Variovorax sp. KK3]|uniref:transglutaminase family protein n=1 Tax=Variovorax sp. KK3 TaxID=1855728 RepID=UPI00097C9DAB|nr:transglutaminase family protein [Variovorax sp. KK3]
MLELPEDQIDVGRAALIFGKEIYPSIDVEACSRKIDAMAAQASRFVLRYALRRDPDSIIRALNTYYYKVWGVRYDNSPESRTRQENNFLHHTLDTRQGHCITIPMLYMAFAQRLGYPVYSVVAPEHMFVRFVDPRLREQNIELTAEAGFEPDEGYAYRLNVSRRAIKSGAYLRTLTRRQHLGVLIQQNAIVIGMRGDLDKAIRYFEHAAQLDPQNVYFPKNLGSLWIRKAKQASSPEWAGKYRQIAYRYHDQADAMGWTHDPDANTKGKK